MVASYQLAFTPLFATLEILGYSPLSIIRVPEQAFLLVSTLLLFMCKCPLPIVWPPQLKSHIGCQLCGFITFINLTEVTHVTAHDVCNSKVKTVCNAAIGIIPMNLHQTVKNSTTICNKTSVHSMNKVTQLMCSHCWGLYPYVIWCSSQKLQEYIMTMTVWQGCC